ncbi:MAG: AAA family ATPase [Desulfovibrionaceae bacterium]|nr:AAA family ATPase [Desulfovibrionaceae bacterium]
MPDPGTQFDEVSFRQIRERGLSFVDKSGFIEELLSGPPDKAIHIMRPSGFGRTVNLTMLRDFLDIRQDSGRLFEGLAVSRNAALCAAWMNRFPVLWLPLKGVAGSTFEEAHAAYGRLIAALVAEHAYLTESPGVDASDRAVLLALRRSRAGEAQLAWSLKTLVRALHAHWGRPAVVLADDLDAPLARAQTEGCGGEMSDFLCGLFAAALKGNDSAAFGLIGGCLDIAGSSLVGGFSNLSRYGIADAWLEDSFGFTGEEVAALLARSGLAGREEDMSEWYGGYRFGRAKNLHCPRDIVAQIRELQANPDAPPQDWRGQAPRNALAMAIEQDSRTARSDLRCLLAGESLLFRPDELLTQMRPFDPFGGTAGLLARTGWITPIEEGGEDDCLECAIPNTVTAETIAAAARARD